MQFGGMDNQKNNPPADKTNPQATKDDGQQGMAEMQAVLALAPPRDTITQLPPLFSAAHARKEFRLFVPCLAALILLAGWWSLTGLLYALWPVHIIAALPLLIATLLPRYTAPALPAKAIPTLPDALAHALPHYTVLIPLFDEANMLAQIRQALAALVYPTDRLEVLLLMEAQDMTTRNAAAAMDWPKHVRRVVIPPAARPTKPAACNFGLGLARGDFITIYDAEDKPHPLRLIAAVARFQAADKSLACLQAPLQIDLHQTGWLQRQFALEYGLLFGIVLPVMARLRLALPLGGTSNHFRTDILRRLGGWDRRNLTEDADLGYRLARHGYRTAILPLPTVENAPAKLSDWCAQRTRWLSGHLQCWHVHLRYPLPCLSQMGLTNFVFFNAIIMARLLTGLTPALFLLAVSLQGGNAVFTAAPLALDWSFLLVSASILSVNLLAALIYLRGMAWLDKLVLVITLPAYWLLTLPCLLRAFWRMGRGNISWLKSPHEPY